MRTRRPSSSGAVCSTITMASAPSGMTAPVMMRTASPAPTRNSDGSAPAASTPATGSSTGAAAVLAARSELDGGAEVVELVAGVVAALGERVAVHVLFAQQ